MEEVEYSSKEEEWFWCRRTLKQAS